MFITVSGERKNYEDNITVSELLKLENVEMPEYVTVSLNEEFLRSESFNAHKLNDGDVVEFLYFMGGGK